MIQNVRIMRLFRAIEWTQVAYNCLSLIFVFYAISSTLTTMLEYRNLGVYRNKYRYKIMYLFNTHVIVIGVIAGAYIALSVFLDVQLFENIYDDPIVQFFRRFDRELPYVFGALMYGHHIAYKKKQVALNVFNIQIISELRQQKESLNLLVQELSSSNRNSLLN